MASRMMLLGPLLWAMTFAPGRRTVQPVSPPASALAPRQLMLDVAIAYSQWGRVDNEARWAPYLCRNPSPGEHRFSQSDDPETHGQKIYALYAKNRDAYIGLNDALPKDAKNALSVPVFDRHPTLVDACDQVIVKESFLPEEVKPGDKTIDKIQHAYRDGKPYRAGVKHGLFIMAHLSDATRAPADSLDDGWIYGTVSPDGKSVTSVGRIASCMKCHEDAPHGRLFGLAKPAPG